MVRRLRLPARLRLTRLLGLAVVCAIAFAYVQPIRAYMEAKDDVGKQRAQQAALLGRQAKLRHRLELTETESFVAREARRIGLVRPGEQLYIVKGLEKWNREHRGR
jgi:cell division protein FtsB